MMELPFPPNEGKGGDALRSLRILRTPPEKAFDGMASPVSRSAELPTALTNWMDADRKINLFSPSRENSRC